MSATREQTVQAPAPAVEAPSPAGWVALSALLYQGKRRGLGTVPAFVTVGLVRQLCRALQEAHERGAVAFGELTLDEVQVGFDGRVLPRAFGEARVDVPAAALILDQLLGETIDAELIRIIGDARLKDPTITTALALEQRLAHWQVKQRQLFPGHDLTAAFASWLFPEQARTPPDEAVQEWLDAQCTGPLLEEPEPRPHAPSRPFNWRRLALIAAGVLVALSLAAVAYGLTLKRLVLATAPTPVVEVAAPPALAVTPQPPEPAEVPAVEAPGLPRFATGAPARLQLSSYVHGVRLEASGFAVTAPWKHWAVKVVPMRGQKKAPRYGALFVAELGDQKVARLSRVGAEGWRSLTSRDARFFLMQTDTLPDDGSFSLAMGKLGSGEITVTEIREGVLTDAMTQIESNRFVLDGLEVGRTYEVLQRPTTRLGGPPVVAIGTVPNIHSRDLRGAGFTQPGAPLDQVLLTPGVAAKVSGVSRLSFVVLTTDAAPEALASIEVIPRGLAPR